MNTILIDCSKVKKLISPIFKTINKSTVLPVLEYVRVTVKDKKLRVAATDLENINTFMQDTDCILDIDVLINASFLKNCINNALDNELKISFKEDIAIFKNEGIVVKHKTLPVDQYPKNVEVEPIQSASIDANDLLVYTEIAKKFISNDDLRPAMTGVYLHEKDGEIKIASTDAHRLYYNTIFKGEMLSGLKAILPPKCVSLLPQFKNQKVLIEFSTHHVRVTSDKYELISRLIDARYPDYEAVFPKENNYFFAAKRTQLKAFLKIAQRFVNQATYMLVVSINGETAKIEGGEDLYDVDNLFDYCLPLYNTSEPNADFKFGINAKFLLEALTINLKDEYVTIAHSKISTKGLIVDGCHLMMPLHLN